MSKTIVLITGANRGLGKGHLQRYLAQPNHIVIAGNRNPAHSTSTALADLPKVVGSRLIVVKMDATINQDAFDAIKELQEVHHVDHLDIVIASAVVYTCPSVAEVKITDLQAHVEPNVYGLVVLYQATRQLLMKSPKEPMFVPVGSTAGCLKINEEDRWLNAWATSPGMVLTDMGLGAARDVGMDESTIQKSSISVDASCDGMVLAESTKDKYGGKLVGYDGNIVD